LRDKRSKAKASLKSLVVCYLFSEGKQSISSIKRKHWLRKGTLLHWGKTQNFCNVLEEAVSHLWTSRPAGQFEEDGK